MGSTRMNITCSKCKNRGPQLTTTSSVSHYRCFCCGYVTVIEWTKPALAQMTSQDHDQGQQQHGRRRRALNWLKGSSPTSSSPNKSKSPSSSSSSSSSSSTSLINSWGSKRALLCGVTYNKRKYKLKGTQNDVMNMKDLLINTFHFPSNCVRILSGINHVLIDPP